MHTSPLAQPGSGDGGGMNVYVRELSSALARAGVDCDVYTRACEPGLADVVEVEPGLRVHNVLAGPPEPVAKEQLPELVGEILRDPTITEAQKQALIQVYVSFQHENEGLQSPEMGELADEPPEAVAAVEGEEAAATGS